MPRLELHKREAFEPPAIGQPQQQINIGEGVGRVQAGRDISSTFARATQLSVLFSEQERKLRDYVDAERLSAAAEESITADFGLLRGTLPNGYDSENWQERKENIRNKVNKFLADDVEPRGIAVYREVLTRVDKHLKKEGQLFDAAYREQFIGESRARIETLADRHQDEAIKLFLQLGNDPAVDAETNNINQLYSNAVQLGVYGEVDAKKKIDDRKQLFARRKAAELIVGNPHRFLSELDAGHLAGLSPEALLEFKNRADAAIRQIHENSEKKRMDAVASDKGIASFVAREIRAMVANGEINAARALAIEKRHLLGDLFPNTMNTIDASAARAEEVEDDPQTVGDFLMKLNRNPNGVKPGDLIKAATDRKITSGRMVMLFEKRDAMLQQIQTSEGQERLGRAEGAWKYLEGFLALPSATVKFSTKADVVRSLARRAFSEELEKNPKANPFKLADSVIDEYYPAMQEEIDESIKEILGRYTVTNLAQAKTDLEKGVINNAQYNAVDIWLRLRAKRPKASAPPSNAGQQKK